jgi:anti-anti-sigma regulatory factor
VTFLDSSGIGMSCDIRDELITNGGSLVLRNPPLRARGILQITGLDVCCER